MPTAPTPAAEDASPPEPAASATPAWGGRSGAEALEAAYRHHAAAVFRFALRCVGRRDLAEDLTSEAFLALHRNLGSVDLGQLPSWLFKVVKNRAIDHWRRQETERRYAQLAPGSDRQEQPASDAGGGLGFLQSPALKPVHRICLVLRYVHGMTRAEVAQRTGLTEMQVKGHLQYALELLRRDLQENADETS
jgi:RNA polymerase sigma-70 factor, ECF subfamily